MSLPPLQAKVSRRRRDRVFVSYSHRDQEWLDWLRQLFAPDQRNDRIDYWDDRELEPGDFWHERIGDSIDRARAAVLLVSPSFLASRFIMEEEVPRILRAAEDGLTVLWVPLSGTFSGQEAMKGAEILDPIQAVFDPAQPLDRMTPEARTGRLLELGRRINKLLNPGRPPRNLPFPTLGNLFKGREPELAQLDEQLRHHHLSAIVQPQVVSGLGGIGKTRLALEYAWRHADDFTALLFASGNTEKNLATHLANLSASTALDLSEQAAKQDEQHAAVIRWLQQHTGWLLILDNVDTTEAIAAVQQLVAQISPGHILITSRYTSWGEGISQLPLAVIPLPDAVALLLEKTHSNRKPRPEDEGEAQELAQRLGCLPLALTHAAAYVVEHDLGLLAYLDEFDRALQYFDHNVIRYETDPGKAGIILKTVATTFFLSFDRLGALDKALLRSASFLAPEPVPIAMFEESPEELKALVGLWCEEKGEPAGDRSLRAALADLARFSLITRGQATFTIHRMVQLVLRSTVPGERVPRWIEATRAVLVHYVPDETAENAQTWPVWDKLRPHAEILVAAAEADDHVAPHLELMAALGALYYGKGLYTESLAIDEAALKVAERVHGLESAQFASRLVSFGETLRAIGRYAEAEASFSRSLAIREKIDGPASVQVASNLNYLAIAAWDQGEAARAEELLRRALTVYEANAEGDIDGFGKVLNNLGDLLSVKGALDEAETLLRRAWHLLAEAFGSEHPRALIPLALLGGVLQKKGDSAQAEILSRRAQEGFERVLGAEHPHVLMAVHVLACVYAEQKRYAEAEPLFWRVLRGLERVLGTEHPVTLESAANLAVLLSNEGRNAEAEPLLRRALEARERVVGAKHSDTLESMKRLEDILSKTGRNEEARTLRLEYRRRIASRTETTSLQLRQVALINYREGEYTEAEDLLLRLLRERFEVPSTHLHLARLMIMLDRFDDARGEAAAARDHAAEGPPYVTQRIEYFETLFALLDGRQPDPFLRSMAEQLLRPGANMEWDLQAMLEHLRPSVTAEIHGLLSALSHVINDRKAMPELEAIPQWRRAIHGS